MEFELANGKIVDVDDSDLETYAENLYMDTYFGALLKTLTKEQRKLLRKGVRDIIYDHEVNIYELASESDYIDSEIEEDYNE